MRVALCASEVFPFAKTGGLADVCGTLPYYLAQHGVAVDIVMPHYRHADQVPIDKFPCEGLPAHVAHLDKNIRVFFIDHPDYFDREELYGDAKGDYPDNFDRFVYYAYQALHLLEELPDKYDVVHCHDWQTGLIATILKNKPFDYQKLRRAKVVFTIHNLAYQGIFPNTFFHKLKLPDHVYSLEGIEFYDQLCFLKGGLVYADTVTTVSPRYAKEIQTKKYGCGLEGVLKKRDIKGILNGLDYAYWNPAKDVFLNPKYDVATSEKKQKHKAVLQQKMNLKQDPQAPLFGFVARLSHQKGIDFLLKAFPSMVKRGCQVVVVGTGSPDYEKQLKAVVDKYPTQIAFFNDFSEEMAHQTYAASDFFLMPSTYEPCGLTQMIALRYGAIPIVAKTGGLVDTIHPYEPKDPKSNGFVMERYTLKAFYKTLDESLALYNKPAQFQVLVRKGFACRFTWDHAAKEYIKIYTPASPKGLNGVVKGSKS